jgi:hypothetical protein
MCAVENWNFGPLHALAAIYNNLLLEEHINAHRKFCKLNQSKSGLGVDESVAIVIGDARQCPVIHMGRSVI